MIIFAAFIGFCLGVYIGVLAEKHIGFPRRG